MVKDGDYVAIFNSVHRVMEAEKLLKEKRLAVLLIPAPRALAADCGLALRYAQGLCSVVAVLDPGAVVLAGPVVDAGGEPLRARIGHHLDTMAVTSPRLLRGTVDGNPVLVGAMCTALDHARATVFGAA